MAKPATVIWYYLHRRCKLESIIFLCKEKKATFPFKCKLNGLKEKSRYVNGKSTYLHSGFKILFLNKTENTFQIRPRFKSPRHYLKNQKTLRVTTAPLVAKKGTKSQENPLILQTCRTAICFAIAVKNPQRDCKLGFLYEAYIEKVSPKRHGVFGKGTQHKNLSDSSQSSKQRRLRKAFKRRRRSEKRRMGRRLNKL